MKFLSFSQKMSKPSLTTQIPQIIISEIKTGANFCLCLFLLFLKRKQFKSFSHTYNVCWHIYIKRK